MKNKITDSRSQIEITKLTPQHPKQIILINKRHNTNKPKPTISKKMNPRTSLKSPYNKNQKNTLASFDYITKGIKIRCPQVAKMPLNVNLTCKTTDHDNKPVIVIHCSCDSWLTKGKILRFSLQISAKYAMIFFMNDGIGNGVHGTSEYPTKSFKHSQVL
jgi:hypothetical protein